MPGELGAESEPKMTPLGEMQDWGNGRWMARREINDHYSLYTPVNKDGSRIVDEDGTLRLGTPIRRIPIFSDELIAEMDKKAAIEEGRAEAN